MRELICRSGCLLERGGLLVWEEIKVCVRLWGKSTVEKQPKDEILTKTLIFLIVIHPLTASTNNNKEHHQVTFGTLAPVSRRSCKPMKQQGFSCLVNFERY